jgi:hypothetical protein
VYLSDHCVLIGIVGHNKVRVRVLVVVAGLHTLAVLPTVATTFFSFLSWWIVGSHRHGETEIRRRRVLGGRGLSLLLSCRSEKRENESEAEEDTTAFELSP